MTDRWGIYLRRAQDCCCIYPSSSRYFLLVWAFQKIGSALPSGGRGEAPDGPCEGECCEQAAVSLHSQYIEGKLMLITLLLFLLSLPHSFWMLKSLFKLYFFYYYIDEWLFINSLLRFNIVNFSTGNQTWFVPGIGHGFTCNLAWLWGQHCAAFQDVPGTIRRAQSDVQLPARHPAARVQVYKSAVAVPSRYSSLNSSITFRADAHSK